MPSARKVIGPFIIGFGALMAYALYLQAKIWHLL